MLLQSLHWRPVPFPVGLFPAVSAPVAVSAADFADPFTIVFRLCADSTLLTAGLARVDVCRISDSADTTFSITILNNVLMAYLDTPTSTARVCLSQKLACGDWLQYRIVVENCAGGGQIAAWKGPDRLMCEFPFIQFAPGSVEVTLAGFSSMFSLPDVLGFEAGQIASFGIFKRELTPSEVAELEANEYYFPADALFAPTPEVIRPRSLARETMVECLRSDSGICRLLRLYVDTRNESVFGILCELLRNSTNANLAAEFASFLIGKQISVRLYNALYELVSRIEDVSVQFTWFEDVLVNCDLWDVTDRSILRHWSLVLPCAFPNFFIAKSYFRYFVTTISNLLPDAILLLARTAIMHFTANDSVLLFEKLAGAGDQVRAVLALIRDCAGVILGSGFLDFTPLLARLNDPDTDVVCLALECVAELSSSGLVPPVIAAWNRFAMSDALLAILERNCEVRRSLFPLVCAILVENPQSVLSVVPRKPHGRLWFFFPLLLHFRSVTAHLLEFIAANAMQNEPGNVVFLACFLASQSPKTGERQLRILLQALAQNAKSAPPDRALSLFVILISLHFFTLDICPIHALDVFDIAKIPNWPFERISAILFRRFDAGDNFFLDQAQALSEFGGQTPLFPTSEVPKTAKLTAADLLRNVNGRTDHSQFKSVLPLLEERLNAKFKAAIQALSGSLQPRPAAPPLPGATEGRVDGRLAVFHSIETRRADGFSRLWPVNLVRVRIFESPKRLLESSQPFEGSAKLSFVSRTMDAKIRFSQTGIRISTQTFSKDIGFSTISAWIPLSEHKLQIIARGCACLIDYSPQPYSSFTGGVDISLPNAKLFAKSIDSLQRTISVYTQKWLARDITNFEYVTILNLLHGRSFCDRSSPPRFPDFIDPVPENYFFVEASGDFQTVYRNRKSLEACPNLTAWLSQNFIPDHPSQPPFERPTCQVQQFDIALSEVGDRIVFCYRIGRKASLNRFVCVRSSGKIEFVNIFFENGTAKSWTTPSSDFGGLRVSSYSGFTDGILGFTGETVLDLREGRKPRQISGFWHFGYALKVSQLVCQVSRTDLCVIAETDQNWTLKPFVSLPASISCFAMSRHFGITAVGCDDGKLRIRANEDGAKVATQSLNGEIPTDIFVTNRWGFVVVKTIQSIFVFTVNGVLIKTVANRKRIRMWISYRTRDGVDFVAYQDENFEIESFEAVDPERLQKLETMMNVAGMAYDWKNDCFLFIADTGKVLVWPRGG
jgi:hypothetical protein